MRYGKVSGVYWGGTCRELLRSFRDNFSTIPGWVVHDDQTAASTPYVVFKTTTSEGAGFEFYTKFTHYDANIIRTDMYEAWDNVGHAGSGNHSGGGRIEHNNGGSNNPATYYYCGDQDHLILYVDTLQNSIHMPTYIGLTTKMQPNHDGKLGVIMVTWYYIDGHTAADTNGYSYSDYNKVPVLRGADGVHDKTAKLFGTYPDYENVNRNGGMHVGVWRMSNSGEPTRRATYWYPMILVEPGGIGPRGILKNILFARNTYYADLVRTQKVKIGSRDYVLIRMTPTYVDANVSNRNPWGQYHGQGQWTHSYVMPTSDWYVPAYIEGA